MYQGNDVRLVYRDEPSFHAIANELGVFEEWKDGIPRASYQGKRWARARFEGQGSGGVSVSRLMPHGAR